MTGTLLKSRRVVLGGQVCSLALASALALSLGACPKDPETGKPRLASMDAREWQRRRDKVDTLAEARSPETLAKIIAATRDPHPKVREAAVNGLANRQDRSVITTLAKCVKDVDLGVRIAAVKALQQFAGARAVSVVLLRVGAGNSQERQIVLRAVGLQLKRSKPAVRAEAARRLAIMVKAERPQTQQDAAGALVELGRHAVGPVLDVLAAVRPGSEGPWVQVLEKALGKIGALAVFPLVKRLRNASNQPALARAAVGPLVRIGKPSVNLLVRTLDWRKQFPHPAVDLARLALVRLGAVAVDGLVGMLDSGRADQRLVAVELLQRIRSPRAAPGLTALLAREMNRTIRLAVVRALGLSRAPQAVAPVLAGLRKERVRGKVKSAPWAAYREALVALGTPPKTVLTMLADKGAQVRLVGAQVAGRLRTKGVAVALVRLLKDRRQAVVGAAAQAIGALQVKSAGKALRRLSYSRNLTVRRHVLTALGRIGDLKARGVLLAGALYKRSYVVQAAAAIGLGRLRYGGAVKTLWKLRGRGSSVVRAAARWAIAEVRGQGKAGAGSPTFCGLLVKQQRACTAAEPEADYGVDLESLCRYGSAGRVENLVRTGNCKRLRAALGRLAVVKGEDVFVSWWSGKKPRKRAEIRFRAGVRQGSLKRWHKTGKPEAKGILHRGRRHGLWRSFWPSGKRRARGRYRTGRPHGAWKQWHAGGAVRISGRYRYGKRRSTWTEYHPNGKRALVFRYKAGKVHGKAESYYPNGKASSRTTFGAGKRHGAWRTWYATGKPRSTGAYQQGKRHGAWVWFHPTGKQREAGSFDKGKKIGTWTVWNAKGEVMERCVYPAQGPPRCTQ